jgi:hypothetical protein
MDTSSDSIQAIAPDFTYVDVGRRFPQAGWSSRRPPATCCWPPRSTADRYFYADRTDLNLAAWRYTAGWFRDQTGLDNSTVLLPDDTSEPRYRLINHARWDRLRDVLPSLLFKRSFRTYVLAHFKANGVAAMPVLYRLVPDNEELG